MSISSPPWSIVHFGKTCKMYYYANKWPLSFNLQVWFNGGKAVINLYAKVEAILSPILLKKQSRRNSRSIAIGA